MNLTSAGMMIYRQTRINALRLSSAQLLDFAAQANDKQLQEAFLVLAAHIEQKEKAEG